MMLDKVLLAILAIFPATNLDQHRVQIQQDGAKAHILDDDKEWLESVQQTGNKITLYTQPAQSPDTNINDLAFFNSIQSLYYEAAPSNELELIDAVKNAHQAYPALKINRMWLTYMSCLNQILEYNGDNHYSIPHMNKDKLERENRLPIVLPVTRDSIWTLREE